MTSFSVLATKGNAINKLEEIWGTKIFPASAALKTRRSVELEAKQSHTACKVWIDGYRSWKKWMKGKTVSDRTAYSKSKRTENKRLWSKVIKNFSNTFKAVLQFARDSYKSISNCDLVTKELQLVSTKVIILKKSSEDGLHNCYFLKESLEHVTEFCLFLQGRHFDHGSSQGWS